jgi:hypothetical protein
MFSISKLQLLIVAAVICLALPLMADTIPITINTGFGSNHHSVSGSVTTGNGTVTISIQNTLGNLGVISIAQNISAIYLRVDGYGGDATLSSSSSTNSIDLSSHWGTSLGPQSSTGWIVQDNVNGWFGVCTICAEGPQPGPDWTIIGGGPGWYPFANGSLNNNDPHNPFLSGEVTFTLNVQGVTANSDILDYYIQFGTTPTPPRAVPDGSSLSSLLMVGGISMAGVIARKRCKR